MTDHTRIAFLRARYDEAEQVARTAGGHRWAYDQEYGNVRTADEHEWSIASRREDGTNLHDWDGEHIALNDPAYVLADIAAKRRLLDWLERTHDWATDNNLWTYDEVEPLRILTEPFASHPDCPKDQ